MYPGAQTQSDAIRNKKAMSVKKSWEGADVRREKNIERFKQNNPMSNPESLQKMTNVRREQELLHLRKTSKGCNFDGTPCRNPLCNEVTHANISGENNPHAIAMRSRSEYKKYWAAHAKKYLGWENGCIRDGKTVCPNCNKIHTDFTKENNPVADPKTIEKIVAGMRGHTYDGTVCKKCGLLHTDRAKSFRDIRLHQDPTFATKPEKIVQYWLRLAGINFRNNVRVPALLYSTKEFDQLNYHPFDIVLDDLKTIIEVNGCYFHGCPCWDKHVQGIETVIRKDAEIKRQVQEVGWDYIVIWEHEIRDIIGSIRKYKIPSDGADMAGLSGLLNESMAPLASIISPSNLAGERSFAPAVSAPQYKWDERTDTFSRID
jgi:G:T-mismatch repair DNA endonuclease (very short patch repair protein)